MAILDQYGKPLSAMDASPVASGRGADTPRRARLTNRTTGLGGRGDKSVGAEYNAVRLERQAAERIYQMSWTAKRLVRIVVDDMFAAGRRWTGEDKGANRAMEEAEAELALWQRLPQAIIAGRIFGTGLLIVCPDNIADFEKELKPEDIKEGGIANLVVVDRWALGVKNWRNDPTLPHYGDPYQYRWSGRIFGSASPPDGATGVRAGVREATTAQNVLVNSDRAFRFDGHECPLTEGWTSGQWEREWGISVLTEALDDIMRDAEMAHAAGHLVNEASVWIQKIEGFRESLARGEVEPDDVPVEELALVANEHRSIYRTLFIDAQDDAERRDVSWGGLIDVLDGQVDRIAAIGGIPVTRFRGTSATGLSATGDGDARDWRITIEALRKRTIDPILNRRMDKMIARHAGLDEPPDWEWNELGEMTAKDEAEVTKMRTDAVKAMMEAGVIDEEEARERLAQDEFWGPFGEFTPSINTELEIERERGAAEMEAAKLELAKNPPAPPKPPGGAAPPKAKGAG